jgi:crotonobetainyl-CoA:carnitine CoA-transferase CaiB-like acyl-CoA transferase
VTTALGGLRVAELGCGLPATYATKLLSLLGADVVKVEPLVGDPERGRGPFPEDKVDRERGGGLFRYLNTDKRSVLLDPSRADDLTTLRSLISGTDLLIESLGAGGLEALGLAPSSFATANPRLAVVRISPFGQHGPYVGVPATGLTVMAMGAWVSNHGIPGVNPVQTGGRLHEYTIAAYAACAGLTAVRAARLGDKPAVADLSALEVMIGTLPYPMLLHETFMRLGFPIGEERYSTIPGIVKCADGWVGINALTGQHFQDICAMLDVPEYAGRQTELSWAGEELEKFFARIRPWLDARSVDEIVGLCQAFRIPAAPVGDGEKLTRYAQFASRPFFTTEPGSDLVFPGPPWRLSATPAAARRAAPSLAQAAETPAAFPAPRLAPSNESTNVASDPALPFAGLRVVDLGTFWAGPYFAMYLGAYGADVVKVESTQRPDGFRFSGAFPQEGDDWYDRGGIWQATNLNKRDVTLDVTRDDGARLVRELIKRADVVIENFAARVVEQFGLGYDELRMLKPDVIMLRMPGFGLEGAWRDYVGWAMGIEQASGMAQVTGYAERPMHPGGFADPMIAMHAGVAVQAALEHRARTGEGQLIEVAQLETACCLTADQPMDFQLNGRLAARIGNRDPRMAPQGVYRCRDGAWVALSVRHDADWRALLDAFGRPLWATGEFATLAGRLRHHDDLDQLVGEWFSERAADVVVQRLREQGLPVGKVLRAPDMYEDPQLLAREWYVPLENPKTGVRRYPAWPVQFSFAKAAHRLGPPTLGQHNAEVLSEIGVTPDERVRLEADGIIGDRMATR